MYKNILKLALVSIILSPSLSVYAKVSYIPADLEQFRKTGSCVSCDLSQADLTIESHNNSNLSEALLVKASLSLSSFNTSNFSNAQIMYASLSYLKASGSNFTSANLTGSDLSNANFSSSDFTNANLTDVILNNAILARANISKEQLQRAKSYDCAIMPDGTRYPSNNGRPC